MANEDEVKKEQPAQPAAEEIQPFSAEIELAEDQLAIDADELPFDHKVDIREWIESRIAVPDSINEEYYQVSPEILDCFPKYRFPVNLYRFKEDIASLSSVYQASERVDNNLRVRLYQWCRDGFLFVSRTQHAIYTAFISRQLDMVLLDKNLRPLEIAEIFTKAFTERLDQFYEQCVPASLTDLKNGVNILVDYLAEDYQRIESIVCYAHQNNDMASKHVNVGFIALALYLEYYRGRIKVDLLESVALGFFLHDIGMTRIPKFVTDKAQILRVEERKKVQEHPKLGLEIMNHLGLTQAEILLPVIEHHERMDGSGYPRRIKGNEISMLGRMCAVADSYVAMITDRPHVKGKKPIAAAVELLKDQKAYDGRVTTLLAKLLQEISC